MSECIDKQIPWFTWDAIEKAKQLALDGSLISVLEWGAGGSSLFWLRHGLNVVSIEHSPQWMDLVQLKKAKLDSIGINGIWKPSLRQPQKTGKASSLRASGYFDEYVKEGLEQFNIHGKFDIVVVDGRARNECMKVATQISTKWIILDNSDRPDYSPAMDLLREWDVEHFAGKGPDGGNVRWRTSFFSKKDT